MMKRNKDASGFAGGNDQEPNGRHKHFRSQDNSSASRINGNMPTDSLANAGVEEDLASRLNMEVLMGSNENCIVEIPANAKEGDIIYISWPQLDISEHCIAIKVPPDDQVAVMLDCESSNASIKRYVKVVPPQTIKDEWSSSPSKPSRDEIHIKSPPITYSPRHRTRRQKAELSVIAAKADSNIGPQYQVLPSQLPDARGCNPSVPANELYGQIWDPRRVEKLPQQVKNAIENVIDGLPMNHKEIMMEALHSCDYDLDRSWPLFLKRIHELKSSGNLPGEKLPQMAEKTFHDALWDKRKDLKMASKVVQEKGYKLSTSSLLVHYYNTFKTSTKYPKLKEDIRNEADECFVCDDGGVLIYCDKCNKAYHLECLNPKLDSIPEDRWYCPECTNVEEEEEFKCSNEKDKESKFGSNHEKDEESKCGSNHKKDEESNSCKPWTYWGINYA